ncbi:hypothetical protein M406DRAFT_334922 [Cryphonectria parasitica EP155]|uniref:Zn(2)-C6 fungal-type domain-containing protein n=1 Tax=Cryphonectria parasitica (strain ATCC 38755 / EP155) TaxID=660469 RepID=A0A9P4XSN1_CRYP1|nr:uncharacterized protein M406DRAFT_334922 [Cryphonectria parasitica EP155]KAF3760244.1 hypothetical protein M406DRAFT_334922 [Cryphonectria parasitica EP155]
MSRSQIMSESREKYACDTCRSRKVGCSRERSGCQRCKVEGIVCFYSRTGILRRNRKRKGDDVERSRTPGDRAAAQFGAQFAGPRRLILYASDANANASGHERLQKLVGRDHPSLKELALLLEEYTTSWHGASVCGRLCKDAQPDFFVFDEKQTRSWVDELEITLEREDMLLNSVPADVVELLAASQPHQVRDRAWLVMFYSIALNVVSSTNPPDEATKAKIRSNLWLAFNDVRLLLEPSVANIQALVVMACYAEESSTPELCWTLVNKACSMLLALGIYWRVDPPTRQRRILMFWRLNVLDKALALMLFRPPSFSREVVKDMPLPTLDQLLPAQAPSASRGGPILFAAHYKNQLHLFSLIVADVWQCFYGHELDMVQRTKEKLESWHQRAVQVLEAAALAEKPLLSATEAASLDHDLQALQFRYYSLSNFLTAVNRGSRAHSFQSARHVLELLPSLGRTLSHDHRRKPYACPLWMYARGLIPAFSSLWVEVIVKGRTEPRQAEASLAALEHVPAFLGRLPGQNTLLAELEAVSGKIIRLVRTTMYERGKLLSSRALMTASTDREKAEQSSEPALETPETGQTRSSDAEQQLQREVASSSSTASPTLVAGLPAYDDVNNDVLSILGDGNVSWGDDFFDTTFDWLSWGVHEGPLGF